MPQATYPPLSANQPFGQSTSSRSLSPDLPFIVGPSTVLKFLDLAVDAGAREAAATGKTRGTPVFEQSTFTVRETSSCGGKGGGAGGAYTSATHPSGCRTAK